MSIQSSSNITPPSFNPPPQALDNSHDVFKDRFDEIVSDLDIDSQVTEIENEHTQLHATIHQQINDAMQVKYSSIFTTYAKELMTNIEILIGALKKSNSPKLTDTIYQIINELDNEVFPTQINYLKEELSKINK